MIASTKVTENAEKRWNLIVERFRAACILHRQHKPEESRRIVKEELPQLIKEWIRLLPVALKEDAKADLRDMFTKEQAIVDQGLKLQTIFKETLVNRIIPQVEEQVEAKYRELYQRRQSLQNRSREISTLKSWGKPEASNEPQPLGMQPVETEPKLPSEAITESIPSLDEIVTTLKQNHLDSILTD